MAPPLKVLVTFTFARWRLLNVQVIVSPGSSLNVAVEPDVVLAVRLAPSSHEMLVRSQPVLADSVEVYVPGTRLDVVMVCPSLIVPAFVPVKVKPVPPAGSVTFLVMIVP